MAEVQRLAPCGGCPVTGQDPDRNIWGSRRASEGRRKNNLSQEGTDYEQTYKSTGLISAWL